MELLLPLLGVAYLVMPIVAFVLGLMAYQGYRKLEKEFHRYRSRLDQIEARLWSSGFTPGKEPPPRQPVAPPASRPAAGPEPPRPSPPAPSAPKPASSPPPPGRPAAAAKPMDKAPPKRRLEEQLGSRLPVWIGSIALALAGIFLVKYTFDRNLLTPAVRVGMAVLFGVVLLLAGQGFRNRSARVAQGLSAAGIAVLYAGFLAGINLYDLIPRAAGFGLMALTTAVAVLLAVQQGPLIAVLGLVGGFLTPALIGSEEPNPAGLFSYLFLLQVGMLVVIRRRRWLGMLSLILICCMGWPAVWIARFLEPGHGLWVGMFLLATVAAFVVSLRPGGHESPSETGLLRSLTWVAVGAGLFLSGSLVGVAGFSTLEWIFLGILGAGCLALGRLDADYDRLPWLASAAGMILLLIWSNGLNAVDLRRYALTALALGAVHAAGSYGCLWGSRHPARWATLSVASTVGYLLIAYREFAGPTSIINWGVLCIVLAVAYAAAAAPVARRRKQISGGDHTLAALAIGVTGLVSLAIPMELERTWITVAWAIQVLAIVWIHRSLKVPALLGTVWVLGALVVIRLILNPWIFEYPIGTGMVWNWFLYGYGIPVVAFLAGSRLLRQQKVRPLADVLEGGGLLLGLAWITLEVRHYFHPGDLGELRFALAEWGAFTVFWLLYSYGLLYAARRFPRPALTWGGRGVAALALGQALLTQALIGNPLWAAHPVGMFPVWNSLLWVYGLPALLALGVAWEFRKQGWKMPARVGGGFSILFFFLLVTLEVRQAFHGSFLDRGETTNLEWYSYSAAWILLGTLLLVMGISRQVPVLRFASLGVMLLAVCKVFLFDTAHLADLYRVFSFLGLGLSLLLLAYLYQRFVFRVGDS